MIHSFHYYTTHKSINYLNVNGCSVNYKVLDCEIQTIFLPKISRKFETGIKGRVFFAPPPFWLIY